VVGSETSRREWSFMSRFKYTSLVGGPCVFMCVYSCACVCMCVCVCACAYVDVVLYNRDPIVEEGKSLVDLPTSRRRSCRAEFLQKTKAQKEVLLVCKVSIKTEPSCWTVEISQD